MTKETLIHKNQLSLDISVVVPVCDEEGNIPRLFQKLKDVLGQTGKTWEVLFVDDGSSDLSFQEIMDARRDHPQVKVIRFRKNRGKSEALSAGFRQASGGLVVTLDADLQESPEEIPRLIEELEKGHDLVSGWRIDRKDSAKKVLASKLFNTLVRWVSGVNIHDVNCGLKIYKKDVIKNLNIFGELHRVIPILAREEGYRVGELAVAHQPREVGESKFKGFLRGVNGILDLLLVLFLARYQKRPLHFFGLAGAVLFLLGMAIDLFLTLRYVLGFGYIGEKMPLLMLGILSMILGFQSFCLGLVGEIIIRRTDLGRANPEDEETWL